MRGTWSITPYPPAAGATEKRTQVIWDFLEGNHQKFLTQSALSYAPKFNRQDIERRLDAVHQLLLQVALVNVESNETRQACIDELIRVGWSYDPFWGPWVDLPGK